MHELSLANETVEIAASLLADYPGARLESITLSIGKFSAVDPEALQFCFPLASEGTPVEGARLYIDVVPLKITCHGCGATGLVADSLQCPACGSLNITVIDGNDMTITAIEIDSGDSEE